MIEDAIMTRLKAKPQTTTELSQSLGYSDRHLRRILKGIPGITSCRKGKSVVYSITTAGRDAGHNTGHDPRTPDTADIPDIGDQVLSENRINPFSRSKEECPAKTPDMNTGHSGHTGHNTGHSGSRQTPLDVPFSDLPGIGHTQPPPTGASLACSLDSCDSSGDQRCRTCPLSLATLERDCIQFVILDDVFRDLVLEMAETNNWTRKQTGGQYYIRLTHLTLQVGFDSVVFYSDDPKNLEWIVSWVKRTFRGRYHDMASLVARIKHPERLTRDELTIVVHDKGTIDAILSVVDLNTHNGTYYLPAPNANTPGLKAYQSKGTLRIEWDTRNLYQTYSALGMRQRMLMILPQVRKSPGMFLEFVSDYYSPTNHSIYIDTGVQTLVEQVGEIARQFTETVRMFADRLEPPTAAPPPAGEPAAAPSIFDILRNLQEDEAEDLMGMVKTLARHLKLQRESVLVFLAAFQSWHQKQYRAPVISEDVAAILNGAGEPLSIARIADAIGECKTAGLMRDDPKLEIAFTSTGTSLGKKIIAYQEGIR